MIVRVLCGLFNEIQELGLLDGWAEGVLTLLYKKGDPLSLANYKPLTLINVDYKLYTEALITRLVRALNPTIGRQ